MNTSKNILFFVGLLLHLLLGRTVYSQDGTFVSNNETDQSLPFTITAFGTEHGLPQNQVSAILQKENGELILSTARGIVLYDGSSFSEFIKESDYKSLIFKQLHWDKKQETLYGIGANRLYSITPEYKPVSTFEIATFDDIYSYSISSAGRIVKTKKDNYSDVTLITETNLKGAKRIFKKGPAFLISTETDVYLYQTDTKQLKALDIGPVNKFFSSPNPTEIFVCSATKMFIVTLSGDSKEVDFSLDFSLEIRDIHIVDSNSIWIAAKEGLIHYLNGEYHYYGASVKLNGLMSVHYYEKENCLFIGTQEKGLYRLQFRNSRSISTKDGYYPSIGAVAQTSTGQLYVTGDLPYISVLSNDEQFLKQALPIPSTYSIQNIDDTLFIGSTSGAIHCLTNSGDLTALVAPMDISSGIHTIERDPVKHLWAGTTNGLWTITKHGKATPFLPHKIKGRIKCIARLSNGNLCVGGEKGLYILNYKYELIKHYGKSEGINAIEVRCLYEDKDHRLWIGTYGAGLFCLDKMILTNINSLPNCELHEDVFTLVKDRYGNLMMTSNNGLFSVSFPKLVAFYQRELSYLIPFRYQQKSGMLSSEFNGGNSANFSPRKNGSFVFPSIQGLVEFDPEQVHPRKLIPCIDAVYINDTLSSLKCHKWERSTTTIGIKFHAPNYLPKYNVHYQYSLLSKRKKDTTWSSLQRDNEVSFTLLPPGTYSFRIRAVDALNDVEPEIITYNFEIVPYFYETLLFKGLLIILLFGLIIIGITLRGKALRKKLERENSINNDILELKLKAIQSKMNPHFIFNSLNSINYLLSDERYDEAELMLQDFSLLLRRFLEGSERTFSTFKEEFNLISLYLEVEKKRFNDSFDVQIELPPEIATKSIPTLLIQPFVENALKHGIAHISDKGAINISVSQEQNIITILIQDNGIGLTRSKEINNRRDKHVSKGIELVKKKIKILNQKYYIDVQLSVRERSNSRGTEVELKLPSND